MSLSFLSAWSCEVAYFALAVLCAPSAKISLIKAVITHKTTSKLRCGVLWRFLTQKKLISNTLPEYKQTQRDFCCVIWDSRMVAVEVALNKSACKSKQYYSVKADFSYWTMNWQHCRFLSTCLYLWWSDRTVNIDWAV